MDRQDVTYKRPPRGWLNDNATKQSCTVLHFVEMAKKMALNTIINIKTTFTYNPTKLKIWMR